MNIIETIKAARFAVASGASVEDAFGSVTSDIRVYREMMDAFHHFVYTDYTVYFGPRASEWTQAEVVDCIDRLIMQLQHGGLRERSLAGI